MPDFKYVMCQVVIMTYPQSPRRVKKIFMQGDIRVVQYTRYSSGVWVWVWVWVCGCGCVGVGVCVPGVGYVMHRVCVLGVGFVMYQVCARCVY